MVLVPAQYLRVYSVNFGDRKLHRCIFKLRYVNIKMVIIMLCYTITGQRKTAQSLHCKPKASPCRCSIYGTPLFIWSYGFTVAQTVAQSMLQPHNQCCSAENRSHMAPHPCCVAAHTHPRPLWGELMGDALANTPSDFCDQIIL